MSENTEKIMPSDIKLWEGSSSFVRQGRHWSSALIWLSTFLFGSTLLWAFLARLDQTISVRGLLKPTGSVTVIESPSSGLVSEVFVEDGQLVRVGDPLIRIEAKGLESRRIATVNSIRLLESESKSLQNIINSEGNPDQFVSLPSLSVVNDPSLANQLLAARNQTQQIRSQLSQLAVRTSSRLESLRLQEQIVIELKPLFEGGGMARNNYLQQVNSVQVLRAEIASLYGERSRLIGTTTAQVNRINRQLLDLRAQLSALNEQLSYRVIQSPANGSVFNLQASTRSLVSNSELLLKIVPQDALVAQIEISNRDIGFVKVGLPVTVAVDSFPSGEFGYIQGDLKSIGTDALPPDNDSPQVYFPATVSLQQQTVLSGQQKLNLQSGMSVTANIKLRSRPAISILTDIFTRQLEGVKRFR